uniref:Putative secreted peptide n=1 Tax=Anopheles braziliensis TaxID=58242 RepID=A0A2M3ZUX3_9DIPT
MTTTTTAATATCLLLRTTPCYDIQQPTHSLSLSAFFLLINIEQPYPTPVYDAPYKPPRYIISSSSPIYVFLQPLHQEYEY